MNERDVEQRLSDLLGSAPVVPAPERLRLAVSGGPAHPTLRRGLVSRRPGGSTGRTVPALAGLAAALVLVGAVLTLVSGRPATVASPSPSASPSGPTMTGSTPPASPIATPSPSASPPRTGRPIAALNAATAHWTRLGPLGMPGQIGTSHALVGFDGGYVFLSGSDTDAVFSTDGQTWLPTSLSNFREACRSGEVPGKKYSDALAHAIATNGREIVIVGSYIDDSAGCAAWPIAWLSTDGRTWQRSPRFPVSQSDLLANRAGATAVWATPLGWQAAVGTELWQSQDGLAWSRLGSLAGGVAGSGPVLAAAADGTIVNAPALATGVFVSHDGAVTWTPIRTLGGCEAAPGVTEMAGPSVEGLDAWVALDDMRLCASRDLESWAATTIDGASGPLAQTHFGVIVLGDACYGEASRCAPEPRAYVTADGATWTRFADPPVYWDRTLADGPAGIILIGDTGDSMNPTVWRLDP